MEMSVDADFCRCLSFWLLELEIILFRKKAFRPSVPPPLFGSVADILTTTAE